MKRRLLGAVVFCLLLLAPSASFAGGPQPLRLGSGLPGGLYYQAGQSLTRELKNVALAERLRVFLRDRWSVGAPWHRGALKFFKEKGWRVNTH